MADPDGTLTLYGARMQALAGRLEGVHQVGLLDLPDGQHGVAVKGPGDTERWLFWGVGTVTLADGTTVLLGPTPTGW